MSETFQHITYRELLAQLSPEQLDQSVTVYVPSADEYYPATVRTATDTDVLDAGSAVLVAEDSGAPRALPGLR